MNVYKRPFVLVLYQRATKAIVWQPQTYLIYTFEEGFARIREIGRENILRFQFRPI